MLQGKKNMERQNSRISPRLKHGMDARVVRREIWYSDKNTLMALVENVSYVQL